MTATDTRHVPDAWPALLNIQQLCAYLGEMSWDTIKRVLPVSPVDMGANVLRYRKVEIDRWIEGLPIRGRLKDSPQGGETAPETAEVVDLTAESRRASALDRVRRRSEGGRCRKTG